MAIVRWGRSSGILVDWACCCGGRASLAVLIRSVFALDISNVEIAQCWKLRAARSQLIRPNISHVPIAMSRHAALNIHTAYLMRPWYRVVSFVGSATVFK